MKMKHYVTSVCILFSLAGFSLNSQGDNFQWLIGGITANGVNVQHNAFCYYANCVFTALASHASTAENSEADPARKEALRKKFGEHLEASNYWRWENKAKADEKMIRKNLLAALAFAREQGIPETRFTDSHNLKKYAEVSGLPMPPFE